MHYRREETTCKIVNALIRVVRASCLNSPTARVGRGFLTWRSRLGVVSRSFGSPGWVDDGDLPPWPSARVQWPRPGSSLSSSGCLFWPEVITTTTTSTVNELGWVYLTRKGRRGRWRWLAALSEPDHHTVVSCSHGNTWSWQRQLASCAR
jgi:hypothetical protein